MTATRKAIQGINARLSGADGAAPPDWKVIIRQYDTEQQALTAPGPTARWIPLLTQVAHRDALALAWINPRRCLKPGRRWSPR